MKTIELTRGKFTIVDDVDFKRLSQHKWHASTLGYACRKINVDGKQKTWYLHWEIVGKPPKGLCTDHKNGNRLDNRKENLRICTGSENSQNSHKHRAGRVVGVMTLRARGRTYYYATRTINGRSHVLGRGKTPEEAHQIFMDSFK